MIGIHALGEPIMIAAPSASRSSGTFAEIWPWLLVLLCVVLAGAILIAFIRRWMRSNQASRTEGFTLSDLRTLQAEGRITKEELQRAEHAMIRRVRADADRASSTPLDREAIPSQGRSNSRDEADSA